jgi:hypothetical protein
MESCGCGQVWRRPDAAAPAARSQTSTTRAEGKRTGQPSRDLLELLKKCMSLDIVSVCRTVGSLILVCILSTLKYLKGLTIANGGSINLVNWIAVPKEGISNTYADVGV